MKHSYWITATYLDGSGCHTGPIWAEHPEEAEAIYKSKFSCVSCQVTETPPLDNWSTIDPLRPYNIKCMVEESDHPKAIQMREVVLKMEALDAELKKLYSQF